MSDKTGIEWTDSTWNPLVGCSRVSAGCVNCYAERHAYRFARQSGTAYEGTAKLVNGKPTFTGRVNLNERALDQPMRWRRPRRIFVNSMSDLFHENVSDDVLQRIFIVMARAERHTFQVLTKRPERMLNFFMRRALVSTGDALHHAARGRWPLPNVWLGVSVEDQAAADERIPLLLRTPAAVRFLSCEPLLGPLSFDGMFASADVRDGTNMLEVLDWVIAGGESGPRARPMHPDWARSLRDQCAAAGVPFFFKQWGEWAPGECAASTMKRRTVDVGEWSGSAWEHYTIRGDDEFDERDEPDVYHVGKKAAGHLLDGVEHHEFPRIEA